MNKNSEIDKLSDKEEILEVLSVVINRLDDIEEKINLLHDPYDLNDYFCAQNNKLLNSDSTNSYKLSDRFDVGETSNNG